MQKQASKQVFMWDEDPRWGNALIGFLAKLLATGFLLSLFACLFTGDLNLLERLFHALLFIAALGIGWLLVATFLYVSLRGVFWLKDAIRRGWR